LVDEIPECVTTSNRTWLPKTHTHSQARTSCPTSPERSLKLTPGIFRWEASNTLDMQRASLDVNAAPAYTEGPAGVELIGVAEKASAAEPEALESWAKSGRGLQTLERCREWPQ